MRLALHVHYRPFSITSEESLRDSEPRIRDRRLHEVLVCETCACHSLIYTHCHLTLCFVKL